jgi:MoaA/NifB/PqqE/SkfB family radical SAM enzyme
MRLRERVLIGQTFLRCLGRLPLRHLLYMARCMRWERPHLHNGRLYVNTFFPPLPSAAFERFLASVIAGRRVPYSTYLAVTDVCPYRCGHCSYGLHTPGRLDTPRMLDLIRQIAALGTVTLGLTGGEPLLREELEDLVSEAAQAGCETILFTTGHTLTPGRAALLASSGLSVMMIGMESDDPAEHDAIRGAAGSFAEGARAVELSLEAGLYTAISTVATREKARNRVIGRMARMARRMGVHEFRILEPAPTGRLLGGEDVTLTEVQSQQLADFHKQWNRRGDGPAVCAFSHLESDAMFGCGAGWHHLFIDAAGNVCPCDLTPLSFGSVLDEPLEAIWRRMGEVFGRPRRGCVMKELGGEIYRTARGAPLPLEPDQSLPLCRTLHPTDLPTIYRNLFAGRSPTGPAAPEKSAGPAESRQ